MKLNMPTINLVYGTRGDKPLVSFGQEIVPAGFFTACQVLGIPYAVTGGMELTHEMEVTPEEFNAIIELCMEAE